MTEDITNELKSLIFENIKPGQYMFSDNFNLEDTLPAIDMGNPKMDRGMVKIEGESLLDFVDSYFKELSEKEIDVSELLRNLFRLEMTWYTGKSFFNDTLLTCILMHRDPTIITASTGNRLAALAVEATMTAASLVSYLMVSSPVIREEDFHPNLYGMNWWTCTYAGGHFPRFNPQNSQNKYIEMTVTPGEMRLNLLLEQLATVCRQNPNSIDRFYYARLYHWIRFLNEFIKIVQVSPESGSIYNLISELQCVIGELEDDNLISSADANIFPELSNLFGYGCVRPVRTALSLNSAIRTWNRSLKNDLEEFIGGLLLNRPRYYELLKKLSERSRDPIKQPILPIFRSILYFSLVQNRFETFYQYESRDKFIIASLPATVSLTKLPDLPLLIQDFVQVYCCNVARQRRFLPDLISFWDERIVSNSNGSAGFAGHRSVCFFKHFRDLLAIDLILLFGHLKLLSPLFGEDLQAAQIIFKIFEKFKAEGKEFPLIYRNFDGLNSSLKVKVLDFVRWQHRWSLISKSLQQFDCFEDLNVPEGVLNWFNSTVKFGKSAFSLSEPDWRDDSFATPLDSRPVGTVFTMYTTERSEIETSESE